MEQIVTTQYSISKDDVLHSRIDLKSHIKERIIAQIADKISNVVEVKECVGHYGEIKYSCECVIIDVETYKLLKRSLIRM